MTPFAIAGVQMHVTTHSNVDGMRHRLDLLMHLYPWVQMVMFSELACHGPLLQNAQPLPGAAEEAFQEMATRHRVWLVNGSMYERRDGAIYNTTSVIDPQGKIVGRYRKMFPFVPLEQAWRPARSSSPSTCRRSASSRCSTATTSGSRRSRAR
jgi:predicted amidohydrolase